MAARTDTRDGKVAFLTNATEYAGPGAVGALLSDGWQLYCHDRKFSDAADREQFEVANPGAVASEAPDVESFVGMGVARFGTIDALVSNDVPVGTQYVSSKGSGRDAKVPDPLVDFELYLDSLVMEPVRLLRAALPVMRSARSGSILLITSGAPFRPPSKGRIYGYTTARAATNMLAKLLAAGVAHDNIQVNAIAPYLVYSQTFFPSSIGSEDPAFKDLLEENVPMLRFGDPTEMGFLIKSLVSGEMQFVSGQIIAFSGGAC